MMKTMSPLGKYVQAIRDSLKGLFNWRLIATVAMYALGGMPKGEKPCMSADHAPLTNHTLGWDEGSTASITQLKSF